MYDHFSNSGQWIVNHTLPSHNENSIRGTNHGHCGKYVSQFLSRPDALKRLRRIDRLPPGSESPSESLDYSKGGGRSPTRLSIAILCALWLVKLPNLSNPSASSRGLVTVSIQFGGRLRSVTLGIPNARSLSSSGVLRSVFL
ncbi:hypothetical protein MTO96_005464 [Rhipicephalus appendiculatus]